MKTPKSRAKRFARYLLRVSIGVAAVVFGLWIYVAQPSFTSNETSSAEVDIERMRQTVDTLAGDLAPRSYRDTENLNATADYIEDHFRKAGGEVSAQEYEVNRNTFKNIRCLFNPGVGGRVVVGAHYDTHADTPGADDNASGVAGLIELAYLLGEAEGVGEVELVAYTLEEPPYFASKYMGSYVHAESLKESGAEVTAVLVYEMIGYFSDDYGSQNYPMPLLHLMYPSTGDFLAVAGRKD